MEPCPDSGTVPYDMCVVLDAIRERGRRDWRDRRVGETQRASSEQPLLLCIWANGKNVGAAKPVVEDVEAAKTDCAGGDCWWWWRGVFFTLSIFPIGDWLRPSKIKDANGRRPNNPLYDKRTRYIPPDVFEDDVSISETILECQKSINMDVLIFFKVGKFYELYEIDVENRHKEVDWKMTMSGVGKCRQVFVNCIWICLC
ncbi:hypothetical protein L1887_19858 [Cichorium endivia]|nr:hypothetical protein L1887_19858 [Cichorium endivia]